MVGNLDGFIAAEWKRDGERETAGRMKRNTSKAGRFVSPGDRVTAFLLNKDGLGFLIQLVRTSDREK